MFVILDEACLRPGAEDDKRVVIHMDKTFRTNPHYLSHANRAKNLKNQLEFQVPIYNPTSHALTIEKDNRRVC